MAESKAGKVGAALGGAALVTAAIALANKRVAAASPEGGEVLLDNETMQLLIALAQTTADIEQLVAQIVSGFQGQTTLNVQGYPPNTESIIATRVQVRAVNTVYPLPDIVVPDDMILQLKGWPTNGGIIYIGNSQATANNINQVWPLLAQEAIGYKVKNARAIHFSGNAVGDWLAITVEQRRNR
jgi:hypothetical protein